MVMNTFHVAEFYAADDRTQNEATRVNSSGYAVAEMQYETTGLGQTRTSQPLYFPVTFRKTPHVSTASSVIYNPRSTYWNDPIGQCGVTSFILDGDGFYIGATVWLRASATRTAKGKAAADAQPAFKVMHYFTFTALGVKNLGVQPADITCPTRRSGLTANLAQEWSAAITYVDGDVVSYEGGFYTAKASSVAADPRQSTGQWAAGYSDADPNT